LNKEPRALWFAIFFLLQALEDEAVKVSLNNPLANAAQKDV
jgi:hypothetical protein